MASEPAYTPGALPGPARVGLGARARGLLTSAPAVAAVVGGLLVLSFVLRTRAIGPSLWIDEGLSIGIASHGLLEIPGVLAQDGSPPLYYALLHVWLALFGEEEARARLLSLAFALLTIPVGLWAGWSLFGARAGWTLALLCTVNPFLSVYAQEVRMYSLMVLLGMVAAAAFAHAFAFRRRAYLPVFAVALAAMLYTHNWAAFFTIAALVALVPCLAAAEDRRALLLDAVLAFAAAALLFLPWVPTLLDQARRTGAPWALYPGWKGLESGFNRLVGGQIVAVILLPAVVAGVVELVRRRRRTELVALAAVFLIAAVTLFVAFGFSKLFPAWATRYLAVLLGPLLLLIAAGLGRAPAPVAVVALVLAGLFTWGAPSTVSLRDRSNVEDAMRRMTPAVAPGTLVLSAQPEQVPALHYYLPRGEGLRFATPLGPVPDPQVMDWRDALVRLRARDSAAQLAPLLAGVRPGGGVLLVTPVTKRAGWRAPWTSSVARRGRAWRRLMAADPRFSRRRAVVPTDRSARSTVRAEYFVRRAA